MIDEQKLQQLENALKEPFLAVDIQQIMSDTIPALIAEIRRLQNELAQYKALSAALPNATQLAFLVEKHKDEISKLE